MIVVRQRISTILKPRGPDPAELYPKPGHKLRVNLRELRKKLASIQSAHASISHRHIVNQNKSRIPEQSTQTLPRVQPFSGVTTWPDSARPSEFQSIAIHVNGVCDLIGANEAGIIAGRNSEGCTCSSQTCQRPGVARSGGKNCYPACGRFPSRKR